MSVFRYVKWFLVSVAVVTLTACGGGSDTTDSSVSTNNSGGSDTTDPSVSTNNKGVFIDSEVEGLIYTTSSGLTGATTNNGEFQFKVGDTIEFFIGNVSIGMMEASELLSVFNTQHPSEVAMFLQSIDIDGNPNNGITIDSTMQALFKNSTFTIEEVSAEDTNFKAEYRKITGKDFVATEFDALKHAESSLALEMLKERQFYNYYIGDIDVYNKAAQYNGAELAKSSSKRMNLYYFNYAILPQLQAEATKYKYNIDSTVNRHDENVKLVASANEKIASVLAVTKKSVTINVDGVDKIYTVKDLNKKLAIDVRDKIVEKLEPIAVQDAKTTMIEGGIIPEVVVEFIFRELDLISSCKDYFQTGGAADCYNALGAAALGTLNDGYTAWVLAGKSKELNTNTIIQTYLSDYFNFAADYNKIYSKYNVNNYPSEEKFNEVLKAIANNGHMSSYAELREIKDQIYNYQMKVYTGTDKLISQFNLNSNMSTGINTNLDVNILDGNTKLAANGDGSGTISTCYAVKNNSFYQVENATISLSVIPADNIEMVLSTQKNYIFSKTDTEELCSDLSVDSIIYNKIIANPYVLKLSVVHDGKTITDSKVLEVSSQNDIYDLIKNVAVPSIKLNIPTNVYTEILVTINASGTTSLISDDTFTYQWEFLSTDKVSGLVLSSYSEVETSFVVSAIPEGKDSLELNFKVIVTSNTTGKSSSKEFYINVLENEIVVNPSLSFMSESHPDGCQYYSQVNCGYRITDVNTLTKTWKFRNNGNVDLQNINLELIDDQTGGITFQTLILNKVSVNVGEDLIISTDISIPDNVVNGLYSAKWRIRTESGYETVAYFKFNLDKDVVEPVVDNMKPTIQFNNTDNETYLSNFNLNVTATDDTELKLIAGVVLTNTGSSTGLVLSSNVSGTSTSLTFPVDISSLTAGSYQIRLASQDTSNNQSDYVYYNFVKENTDVVIVTGIDASDGLYVDKIRVAWAEDSAANSYIIYRCMNTSVDSCSELANVVSTTYDDLTALASSIYYYRVKSIGTSNTSDFSEYDAGSLSADASLPVTNAPNASDGIYFNKIEVSWDEISGVVAGAYYEVYRCDDTTIDSCKFLSRRSNTTYTDEVTDGIKAGKTYYYRVRIQGVGNEVGEFSNYDIGYLDPEEPTVQKPIASQGTHGDRVNVTWIHVTGASHYNLYACDTFGIYPESVESSSECRSIALQTALDGDGNIYTKFDDTNVVPGDKYWYHVRAKKDGEYGEFSSGSNSGYAGLNTPLIPTVHVVSYTEEILINVSLPGSHGAEYYEIYRCTTTLTDSCTSLGLILPYDVLQDTGMNYNTDYYYRAKSISYSGNSSEFSEYIVGRAH